jgi:uncharacterized protein (DUF1330 family)
MELHNALMPNPDVAERFRASTDPTPVVMVNLLRFRPKAVYADGRPSDLTGEEAFMVYSAAMNKIVTGFGGRFVISALIDELVIGSGDLVWHRIAMVEYPSRQAFIAVASSPEVKEAAVHRHAGLEGQLLISTRLQSLLGNPVGAGEMASA